MSITNFSPVPPVTPSCFLAVSVDEERKEAFALSGGAEDEQFS